MRQGASDPSGHSELHLAVQRRAQTDRTCHSASVPGHRQSSVPGHRLGTCPQVLAQSSRRRFSPAAKNGNARDSACSLMMSGRET